MSIKSLENLLNPNDNGGLGEIVRHARDMGELVSQLQKALPDEIGPQILAANIRDDGELIVLTSSPAWAAKLRFEADALLDAARATGADGDDVLTDMVVLDVAFHGALACHGLPVDQRALDAAHYPSLPVGSILRDRARHASGYDDLRADFERKLERCP